MRLRPSLPMELMRLMQTSNRADLPQDHCLTLPLRRKLARNNDKEAASYVLSANASASAYPHALRKPHLTDTLHKGSYNATIPETVPGGVRMFQQQR